MNAQLIAPDGTIQVLTDNQYARILALLQPEQKSPQATYLLSVLDEIEKSQSDKDKAWWEKFEQELQNERLTLDERDIGLQSD